MKKIIYFLILILIFSPTIYAKSEFSGENSFYESESLSDYLGQNYEHEIPDYFDHEVIIPVKIINYFGFANYYYLTGKPRAKIQFGEEFEYVFKLNNKIGLILTDQEVEKIKAKNEFLTLDTLVSRGTLVFKEKDNSPISD